MVPVSPTRWLLPVLLAAGLGTAALTPVSARAADLRVEHDLVRVVVDIADVIFRGGHPYYRHPGHGHGDRLIVVHDRRGHPVYYRELPRDDYYRHSGPPYGQAHGYRNRYRVADAGRRVVCDRYGGCIARRDDPHYDRRYYYSYHDHHDRDYRDYRDRYGDGWRHRRDD